MASESAQLRLNYDRAKSEQDSTEYVQSFFSHLHLPSYCYLVSPSAQHKIQLSLSAPLTQPYSLYRELLYLTHNRRALSGPHHVAAKSALWNTVQTGQRKVAELEKECTQLRRARVSACDCVVLKFYILRFSLSVMFSGKANGIGERIQGREGFDASEACVGACIAIWKARYGDKSLQSNALVEL